MPGREKDSAVSQFLGRIAAASRLLENLLDEVGNLAAPAGFSGLGWIFSKRFAESPDLRSSMAGFPAF
jgi:hypothetical protein